MSEAASNWSLESIGNWFGDTYASIGKSFATKRLETRLASIVDAFRGHQDRKAPKHSQVYVLLKHEAFTAVDKFCEDHKVTRNEVIVQFPTLAEIQDWGGPRPSVLTRFLVPGTVAILAIGVGLVATGAGVALFGFVMATGSHLFHWGYSLASHF